MELAIEAAGQNGPAYLTPDGIDITRLVRLHRRYHGQRNHGQHGHTHIRLRDLMGKTSRRPDADDAAIGHSWRAADAKLDRERDNDRPYRGSRDEQDHRAGRRLPRGRR